jgi:competence protein ComEC
LWSASLAIGIAVALLGELAPAAGMALAAAIVALGVGAWTLSSSRVLAGACVWLGAGVGAGARAQQPATLAPAIQAAIASQEPARITARVVYGPEIATRGARLIVDVQTIASAPRAIETGASARLALSVVSGWPDIDLVPGDRVRFSARVRPLRGLCNPGLPDPTLALRSAGVDLLAGVGDPSALARLAGGDGSLLAHVRAPAFRARRAMRAAIWGALAGDQAAFLQTAVLGDRRGVDEGVESGFRAAGASHVLSVSGLHLAAVAVIFLVGLRWVLSAIPALPLFVDPRAVAACLALPAVGFFVLVTGEAVATLRSALMIAVALTGFLVNRPASAPATLGTSAAILLLGSPLLLLDVSLQLSLASVIGIAVLARSLGPRGPRATTIRRRAGVWLWRFGAATLSATAVTAPLGAHHFGEIAPAAPLGNLVLVPLVEMVVVPFGLAGAALATVWPIAGWLPLRVAGFAARLALGAAALFREHAPLWLCRMPNGFETLALIAAAVLALAAAGARSDAGRAVASRPRSGAGGGARTRWRLLVAAACALAAATGSLAARALARQLDPDLRVTFLDVGQGDAALVEAPGGPTMIIDGGGSFDGAFDPGERIIEPLLRRRAIDHVDVVALSHPHPDHLNGLQRVLERFRVTRLWTSGDDGHNPDYARLLATAHRRGVDLPAPAPLALGALAITPLGPWWGDRIAAPLGLSVNDASLVLRLDFGGHGLLFPGDLEADGEGELVGRQSVGDRVAADVLKVPHHGSRTSSSPELIAAVAPSLAVISLGWQNRFHFPDAGVLARYAARGTRVLRTDRDGAVTVRISARGTMSVTCARGCPPLSGS